MTSALRLIAVGAFAALTLPAFADTTTYTSSSTFAAALQAGAYTETFDVANPAFPAPVSINYADPVSGFSFRVAATGGVYTSGVLIGGNAPAQSLVITFGPGITAVGGNFFLSDINDAFVPAAPITLTLNDGTTTTYTPADTSDFFGFTSTSALTSLTFAAPVSNYATFDNLTVGAVAAVPEAGTWALMAFGLAGLMLAARKRQA